MTESTRNAIADARANTIRKPRMYSLFEKQNGKWVRIDPRQFWKNIAIRVYQNELLASFLGCGSIPVQGERSLRPVN